MQIDVTQMVVDFRNGNVMKYMDIIPDKFIVDEKGELKRDDQGRMINEKILLPLTVRYTLVESLMVDFKGEETESAKSTLDRTSLAKKVHRNDTVFLNAGQIDSCLERVKKLFGTVIMDAIRDIIDPPEPK